MENNTRKRSQREFVARRLAAHLLDSGLGQTSLRQLAAAAGVSDRMLLYYFSDKAEALACAITVVGADLARILGDAVPLEPKLTPSDLIAKAIVLTSGPNVRPYMALWIAIVAAAARGEAPYPQVAKGIAAGFLDFVQSRLAGEPAATRSNALVVLAMIDGLALIAASMGEENAAAAASAMARVTFPR
jgi:AcrR family transcriptional regulator